MTVFMDKNFNPANYPGANDAARQAAVVAEVSKWYGFYNGGTNPDTLTPDSPNTIAAPAIIFDGANSHMLIEAAPENGAVEVAGAFATKAAMDADLDAAAGQLVNCWDPLPANRGRYEKQGAAGGGSWLRIANAIDKFWPDPNHVGKLLEIPLGTWVNSSPPFPLRGLQAGYEPAPGNDWTNVRVTYDMEVEDFYLGPTRKMGLHCQGNVAALTAQLAQVNPSGNYAFPNFIQTRQLISDQLGFAQPGSWGKANVVPYIDKIRKQVVIDLTPNDLDWYCLGRIDRSLAASPYRYVACPIAQLLANMTGNFYMLSIDDVIPQDSAYWAPQSAVGIKERDRIRGKMRIYSIKTETI